MVNITVDKKEQEIRELINPYIQLFDNDVYHELEIENNVQIECDDDYMRNIRMIRRRYTDLLQYEQARVLYEEYIQKLIEAYGGEKELEVAVMMDDFNNYLPPRPTLKPTRRVKMLLKNGLVVENKLYVPDDIADRIKEMRGEEPILKKESKIKMKKILGKNVKKELDIELGNEIIGRNKKLRKASSIKFLEMYFQEKEDRKKKKKEKPPTLRDYFEDNVEIIPEDAVDPNATTYYRGKYVTNAQKEEYEFYDNLEELGWDPYKIIQDSISVKELKKNRTTSLYLKDKKKKKKEKKDKSFGSKFIKSLSQVETYGVDDLWDFD
jgi:hypothetical protein